MAHWIIEDRGFSGVTYRCSNCRESWDDYYCKFPKDFCAWCGEPIDEDANEYIDKSKKCRKNNTIIFPQTIGSITFYSKAELFEWVESQQQVNKRINEIYEEFCNK